MEKDIFLKRYLSDDERFADLLNGFVFQGEQVVCHEDLQEMDSQVSILGRWSFTKKVSLRYRDLLKKVAFGVGFVVIGLENQEAVNYGMPVRALVYDTGEYDKQMRQIRRIMRKRKNLTSAEWLSGFTKRDRLMPVITIVIYYGEHWDGAKSLYEMIDFHEIPEQMKKFVNDYHLNILDVRQIEDTSKFRTDIKQVFEFIKYSKDKKRLLELVENDVAYSQLDEEAYDVATQYANAEELIERKNQYWNGGMVDMCQAIKELMEDSKLEGIQEGIHEGEECFAMLTRYLIRDDRTDDLLEATSDSELRNQLYIEYRIKR